MKRNTISIMAGRRRCSPCAPSQQFAISVLPSDSNPQQVNPPSRTLMTRLFGDELFVVRSGQQCVQLFRIL
jgi:hypothetical protein